jgi:hypothetical protein
MEEKKEIKKRGRKPKGGKIIENKAIVDDYIPVLHNIILHLKCSTQDIKSTTTNVDIEPFTQSNNHSELVYENENVPLCQKLKILANKLHFNDMNMSKTNCFWCTCSYDNPSIYIPKSKINDVYQVYGSFCCPECASAYLFQEKIDDSTMFERYHLLNYLYGSIYNYTRNFIPAPPPHYLLSKFGGTLTIQEYRATLKSDKINMIVSKPICCVYPELIQSNNEYMITKTVKNEQNYKLCRKKNI